MEGSADEFALTLVAMTSKDGQETAAAATLVIRLSLQAFFLSLCE
jgi:hypothetical protein